MALLIRWLLNWNWLAKRQDIEASEREEPAFNRCPRFFTRERAAQGAERRIITEAKYDTLEGFEEPEDPVSRPFCSGLSCQIL